MHPRDYFPLGIASGKAFCNRELETQLLSKNIQQGKHTLLMTTRRYGKSSLVLHTLQQSGLPYVETDFYMATHEKMVETYILNSVVELIGKALGPLEKLSTSIKRYVKNLKPKIEIGGPFFKLELSSDQETDPASNVKEGLWLLEQLLEEKKTRAVLYTMNFKMLASFPRVAE